MSPPPSSLSSVPPSLLPCLSALPSATPSLPAALAAAPPPPPPPPPPPRLLGARSCLIARGEQQCFSEQYLHESLCS